MPRPTANTSASPRPEAPDSPSRKIPLPYVLFLGDAHDQAAAKTADGIAHWRPDWCVGQLRLPGCRADVGLPEVTVEEAAERGARTLVVGVANRGGRIPDPWEETLLQALRSGLNLASGLHTRISAFPTLREAAREAGLTIFDVRVPPTDLPVGTGVERGGRRLLTVGTDCSVGKMYTALALTRELQERGVDADFRATGQTGIFIVGEGIPLDAVPADFIAGAAEVASPEAPEDHWDVIEGQGSLVHPSYAGVTLGLLQGSQPDAMVLCLEPGRQHLRGLPHAPSPDPASCIPLYEELARVTNPGARVVGVSANTRNLSAEEAERALQRLEETLELPAVDPVRTGVERLVEVLPG